MTATRSASCTVQARRRLPPYICWRWRDARRSTSNKVFTSTRRSPPGERREESPACAKHLEFEPDRSDNRTGKKGRHVDRWRPVIDYTEADVGPAFRCAINVHPVLPSISGARAACTIFRGPEQRAAGRAVDRRLRPNAACTRSSSSTRSIASSRSSRSPTRCAGGVGARSVPRRRGRTSSRPGQVCAKYAKTFNLHDKEAIDVEPAAYKLDPVTWRRR